MKTHLQSILTQCESVVRIEPNKYLVSCPNPAHNDRKPSCIISQEEDGTIRVHCFVCGDWRAIRAALGLTRSRGDRPARPRRFQVLASADRRPSFNADAMQRQFLAAMTDQQYTRAAASLGVSVDSLMRLGAGYYRRSLTFPMRSPGGCIIGFRRRFGDGNKVCIRGSRNGHFIPAGLTGTGLLLVVEGNTDCAAGLDLGFDCIGRPNCNSLVDDAVKLCRGRHVVVVPDADRPGIEGAEALMRRLVLACPILRMVLPPEGTKDVRAWRAAGLTREEFMEIVHAAPKARIAI